MMQTREQQIECMRGPATFPPPEPAKPDLPGPADMPVYTHADYRRDQQLREHNRRERDRLVMYGQGRGQKPVYRPSVMSRFLIGLTLFGATALVYGLLSVLSGGA